MNLTNISNVLKKARIDKGLSIREVQRILSVKYDVQVTDKSIYRWEAGEVQMRLAAFLALCDLYDIRDLHKFDRRNTSKDSEVVLTDAEKYVLQAYRRSSYVRKEIQKCTGMPLSLAGYKSIYED